MLRASRNLIRPALCRASVHTEARIAELGLELPLVSTPAGNYVQVSAMGNLRYTAGQLPIKADGSMHKGKVGREVDLDEAHEAARRCAIQFLANLKHDLGDLDRVKKVVKVVGFVNSIDDFEQHPAVINGCSNLIGEVFGERGVHARSAVGSSSLPFGVPVEIEFIVEVD
jgi:enamine deaminase RidA (YjgF/YER057c/UK114 family)